MRPLSLDRLCTEVEPEAAARREPGDPVIAVPVHMERNQRMIGRLRASPEIQAILARDDFVVADAVTMILNMNSKSQDFRHRVAFHWCTARVNGRWRRRIVERRGGALLDKAIFEFEHQADADAFDNWLADRGW